MAKKTEDDSPPIPVSEQFPEAEFLYSESRSKPAYHPDGSLRTAVEIYHIFKHPHNDGLHEEYDHENSNVHGPTQSRIIPPVPVLRGE